MKGELSAYSAETLLAMVREEEASKRSFSYEAGQALLKRWRHGIDLEVLIELLQSKMTSDRIVGAYLVREIGGPVDGLRDAVLELADDALHDCRWSFVCFMLNARFYDEEIAIALAKCLRDFNLVVRVQAIEWAVFTADDRFKDFCRRVESGKGARSIAFSDPANTKFWTESDRKRATTGLGIAHRLRNEETVEAIRATTPEEDGFVFDSLQFSHKIMNRWIARRKSQLAEH